MRIFGLEITRSPRLAAPLTPPGGTLGGGWFPVVREPYMGAWQENAPPLSPESALANFAVFACVTMISTDMGKMQLRLVQQDDDGIWTETTNSAYSPVLRKPNRYQTIVNFVEQWTTSKLTAGNAYVLKARDERGVVAEMHVLDPACVTPLVAPDGGVFYRVKRNELAGLSEFEQDVVVPAREIIHDRMYTFFHPLVGIAPLYACALAAQQGLTMQAKSEQFFRGGSNPGGTLTTPEEITKEQAARIKADWEREFSGPNLGRIAVLQRGLKYEPMTMSASDAQLIEQMNFTAQQIATCFHVPLALLEVGPMTAVTDLEALHQKYHSQCIQTHVRHFETSLDEGLELKTPFGTEFDIDDLIWMVTATKTKAAAESIGAGAVSPDEARKKYFGLGKVKGGDTPYMQQQNFSLAALAERDADKPFAKPAPPAPAPPATPTEDDDEAEEKQFLATLTKALEDVHAA